MVAVGVTVPVISRQGQWIWGELVSLPFSVQSHVVCKINLGWKDNTAQIVCVHLRALMEHYAVLNNVPLLIQKRLHTHFRGTHFV